MTGGGHLVTTYQSGVVDLKDHIMLTGYPGAFRDLLGIRIEEWAPVLEDDSVRLDDGATGTIWSEEVDVAGDSVDILRTYTEGDLKGKAAITGSSHGKGSASYISTHLGNEGLQRLLPELLTEADVTSSLLGSLRNEVENVIRIAQDGKTEWDFLINRTATEVELKGVHGELMLGSGDPAIGKLGARGVSVFRRTL